MILHPEREEEGMSQHIHEGWTLSPPHAPPQSAGPLLRGWNPGSGLDFQTLTDICARGSGGQGPEQA